VRASIHNLNTCTRLYQRSQVRITLLVNNNYWSVSKPAETSASRPRPRPQNFGLERSWDEDRGLEDYKTGVFWCDLSCQTLFRLCIRSYSAAQYIRAPCKNPITAHNRFLAPLSKLNSTLQILFVFNRIIVRSQEQFDGFYEKQDL